MLTSDETQPVGAVLSAPNGDAMWTQRTATLLDVLAGTGIDLASETLLDDVIEAAEHHPQVSQFLVNLPGYPNDPATAIEQLGYLTDMAASAQSRGMDHG